MAKEKGKIYTVRQINSQIKGILEAALPGRLIINGEISNWRPNQSGHCYFSLKDETSTLPCVMWKSSSGKLKFEPENGMEVLATGTIDVYVPHGRYQFVADKISPAGKGDLQLAFEQMVEKLRAKGLFDDAHKKELPPYPQRIAILTSETGAAVKDIQDSIQSRWPCVKLYVYPVPVQGTGAAGQIAYAIRDIANRNDKLQIDTIILGRGGGSMEDLWAFNEEILAQAIFDSPIPIISAVGHEIDVTVADMVADARASTPTKAGMVAVPDLKEVLGQLDYFTRSLRHKMAGKIDLCSQTLETILASSVFRNPHFFVQCREQQLDDLGVGLENAINQMLAKSREFLRKSFETISSLEPHRVLGRKKLRLIELENKAKEAISEILHKNDLLLTAKANRLEGLNPKTILQRGYSITTNARTGQLVRQLTDVETGDLLITEISDKNFVESQVKKKQNRGLVK